MAILPLVILPDPLLKQVSKPVESVTPEIRKLAADMLDTMYDAPGIGLAAVQVGVPLRAVTVDLGKTEEERQPIVFLNPEIVWESEELGVYEEGCLSIPEFYEEVERPAVVRVKYMGLDGKTHELEADGLMATCIQHEIDHLNGVLFIDHISKLKRDRCVKKFIKQAKERERGA